jgi:hypothetical protein
MILTITRISLGVKVTTIGMKWTYSKCRRVRGRLAAILIYKVAVASRVKIISFLLTMAGVIMGLSEASGVRIRMMIVVRVDPCIKIPCLTNTIRRTVLR